MTSARTVLLQASSTSTTAFVGISRRSSGPIHHHLTSQFRQNHADANSLSLSVASAAISRRSLLDKCAASISVRLFSSNLNPEGEEESDDNIEVDRTLLTELMKDSSSQLTDPYKLVSPEMDYIPLEKGQRLVCVGDVHGDLAALKGFLRIAQVYDDEQDSWTGGNTILVQCGDVLDRGGEELACFELLAKLSREAVQTSGAVILLHGNHEALNAIGAFQYAFDSGNAEYEERIGSIVDKQMGSPRWRAQYGGNVAARWAAMEPGGLLAQPLLQQMKVAVKVGRTVCVHGGLTLEHLQAYDGINGMNQAARDWIGDMRPLQREEVNNYGEGYETADDVIQSAQRRAKSISKTIPSCLGGGIGSTSPVWLRQYSQPANGFPDQTAQDDIDATLKELECDRMVMGHTPQSQINVALHGKAWRIDVGASKGVRGGTPEVLEVKFNGESEEVSVLTQGGSSVSQSVRMVEFVGDLY